MEAGRTKLSFCRQCMGHCGVVVEVDEHEQLVAIRGDSADEQTLGYACFKGLNATEAHNSQERILHPLKRQPDGSFAAIPIEKALDEIAEKLRTTAARDGWEAIAGYKGGGAFFTSSSSMLLNQFLAAVGSPKAFSTVTIDQSAKAVTASRMGIWSAGRDPFHASEVLMLVGHNPLVSISSNGFDTRNPQKRLKQVKARGTKLIVIDPRQTETARFADVFLQPLPGEDCSVLAGLLHIIFEEGWGDDAFCDQYADQVDILREAVSAFTPSVVAARADVPAEQLHTAARVFAEESRRGAAIGATGPDMSAHGNLAEHLLECLNVVCGRFVREGERVANPGVIGPSAPRRAEVVAIGRSWEESYRSRVGDYGLIGDELPTATLPDEILTPGKGQVKCLIVHGGNPVSAIPEQDKVIRACESLELLVSIEPFMTTTAELSDYILPPTLQYERSDLPLFIYETLIEQEPFTRYTPAVAKPPEGAEVQDDHHYFLGLARRLGVVIDYFGVPLDSVDPPSTDDLLAIAARNAPFPFEELRAAERGLKLEREDVAVQPPSPGGGARFQLMPADVAAELASVQAEWDVARQCWVEAPPFPYRLAVRRLRDGLNSAGLELPSIKERVPYNAAYLNPEDMEREGLKDGDALRLESLHGHIEVTATADPTVRGGVVSIAHGFGGLPGAEGGYRARGASTNRLLSLDAGREAINAMPRMSGIPVGVMPL
jgi:anaerobic selenocysteine-containing dehydrogenase